MLMHCPNCHSSHILPIQHNIHKSDPVFSHLSLQHIIQCAALGAKLGKRISPRHPVMGMLAGAVLGGIVGGLTTAAILPVTIPFIQPGRAAFECQDCGYRFDPMQQPVAA